jgi:hypothetical protein
MTTFTYRAEVGEATYVERDFGVVDNKRRAVGARVRLIEVRFEALPEGAKSWCEIPPGTYYEATPHATRGGIAFGPLQHEQRFTTLEARDAYVEKYFEGARKRAVKAWGGL